MKIGLAVATSVALYSFAASADYVGLYPSGQTIV